MARRQQLSKSIRNGVFDRWGDRCIYCDAPATTIDHVVPLSKFGSNRRENMRPACWGCNKAKGRKDAVAFMRSLGIDLVEIRSRWALFELADASNRARRAEAWHRNRRSSNGSA